MAIYKKSPKIKIDSDLIKVVVASYFRYKLRYEYVCTEYDCKDIVASNSKYLTEIEVKISYSDLIREKKKDKHKYYIERPFDYISYPNYFYFAITEDMYKDDRSMTWIESNYKNYGIMYVSNWREPTIIKRPTLLHKNKVSQKELSAILKRITSENICLRKRLYELKNK